MNFSFWCRRKRQLIPPSFLPASSISSFQYIPVSCWTGIINTDMVANRFGNRFTSRLLYEIVPKSRHFHFLPNKYAIGIHSIFKIDIFWTYKQKSAVDLMRQSSVWGIHSLLLSTADKSVSDVVPVTSSSRRDTSCICSRRNVTINSSISTETKNTDKQMWGRPWLKTVSNIYKANCYVTHSREK